MVHLEPFVNHGFDYVVIRSGDLMRPDPHRLLTLRDDVIAPIVAGVRSPWWGRRPTHWTHIDRHYEILRVQMQALFKDLWIAADPIAA